MKKEKNKRNKDEDEEEKGETPMKPSKTGKEEAHGRLFWLQRELVNSPTRLLRTTQNQTT